MKAKIDKILVQYENDSEAINITDLDRAQYEAFLNMMKEITLLYYAVKSNKVIEDDKQ